jgi:hypothetical protein
MKKYLIWFFSILAISSLAYAAAGDRAIHVNSNQDGDSYIQVNKGGVATKVVDIDGATGNVDIPVSDLNVGDTSDGQQRSLRLNVGNNSVGNFTVARRKGLETNKFEITNSSSEVTQLKRFGSTAGFGRIDFVGGNTISGSSGFGWLTESGTQVGSANAGGGWSLGPVGHTGAHGINGGVTITTNSGSSSVPLYITGVVGPANQGMLHIRPFAANAGYISFTESTVGDKWAMGFDAGGTDFNMRQTHATGTIRARMIAGQNGWQAPSDIRMKENIELITDPLEKISGIRGVTYVNKNGGPQAGVIAQEVYAAFKIATHGNPESEEYMSVDPSGLIGLLIESVKTQQAIIESLKSRIETLESAQ